jgi:hypothetical protein
MIVMDDKKQQTPTAGAAPPAAPATAPAPQAAKLVIRQPKVGDEVWLHTPPGNRHNAQPLPANITAVIRPTIVNLKTTDEAAHDLFISRSPFDPTGQKPDSWRFRD